MKLISIFCFVFFSNARAEPDLPGLRIIGGNRAYNAQFPHQISLRFNNKHTCGGSILNPTTILTAAHCVVPFVNSKDQLTVVAGTNKLSSGGNVYKVKTLVYHNRYNSYTNLNDIGIIKLQTAIQYSNSIQPIKLPFSRIADNVRLTLSGWGLISYPSSSLPDDLQYVQLVTINKIICAIKMLFHGGPITYAQVCTLPTGRVPAGACKGDSGGALIGEDGRQYGIVSWGIPCAKGKPDVFTSVFYYKSWIENYMITN